VESQKQLLVEKCNMIIAVCALLSRYCYFLIGLILDMRFIFCYLFINICTLKNIRFSFYHIKATIYLRCVHITFEKHRIFFYRIKADKFLDAFIKHQGVTRHRCL